MPNPTRLTAPPLGAGAPPSPPPLPANDGSPETGPAAGRPAGHGPADGHGPAEAAPPPAAEADAAAPPRDGAQRAAFDALRLALREGHVFAALTGPAGTGKTAVLDAALASQSGRRLRIIRIVEPDRVTAELAARIEQVAQAEATKPANADAHVVLAVDDAHAASDELLGCLTRLAAAERTMRLPQIFLAGRPSLWDRLAAEEHAPLAVRLVVRPVLHAAEPEDPWAAIEQDLVRARGRPPAGAAPGTERTPDARLGAAPFEPALLGAAPLDPASFASVAPPADDAPGDADPASARRRGGVLVPLVVSLAAAGAGLYALARHDWSPQHLAAAVWAEAGRQISITRAPPDPPAAPAAAHRAPDRPPVDAPMFPEPDPVADAMPAPAEAGAPVLEAALVPAEPVPAPPAPAPQAAPAPEPVPVPPSPRAALAPAEPVPAPPDRAPQAALAPEPVPVPQDPVSQAPVSQAPASQVALAPEPAPASRSTPVPASVPAPDLAPVGQPKAPFPVMQDAAAPEAPPPPAPAEPAPAPPPRPADRLAAAVAPPVQPDLLVLLLRRGDERLALGDLSAARLFYARAASLGSAQAARLVARTYDRAFLDPANAGAAADEHAALAWYRRAAALGDAEAAAWLRRSDAGR